MERMAVSTGCTNRWWIGDRAWVKLDGYHRPQLPKEWRELMQQPSPKSCSATAAKAPLWSWMCNQDAGTRRRRLSRRSDPNKGSGRIALGKKAPGEALATTSMLARAPAFWYSGTSGCSNPFLVWRRSSIDYIETLNRWRGLWRRATG